MDVDATAFAFGACRCSNPVALALALVLLRRLFLFLFQRCFINRRDCIGRLPHQPVLCTFSPWKKKSSYPLLSWRSIEMQASQLAYPMILFVFSSRWQAALLIQLISCMACMQDGDHSLLSSWLFFYMYSFSPPYSLLSKLL